jgi:TPR repeat protein
MYETGKGVERDFTAAIDWYGRASKSGHVLATCALGLIYKFGPDHVRNQSDALKFLERAAAGGSSMAALQFADSLERGLGTSPNESAARDWYFRAAQLSDESSAATHAAIATLYREGRLGLGVDPVKADEWAASSQRLLEKLGIK